MASGDVSPELQSELNAIIKKKLGSRKPTLTRLFDALVSHPGGLTRQEIADQEIRKGKDSSGINHNLERLEDIFSRCLLDMPNEPGQRLRYICNLASENDGRYSLSLERVVNPQPNKSGPADTSEKTPLSLGAEHSFWSAHKNRDFDEYGISLFISVPTFFRIREENKVFRHTDINPDLKGKKGDIRELREKYPAYEEKKSELENADIYLLRGEVEARDVLARWFYEDSGFPRGKGRETVIVKKKFCINTLPEDRSFKRRSSVLLGSPRTSPLTQNILKQAKPLAFHMDENGKIAIDLSRIPDEAARMSLTLATGLKGSRKKTASLEDKVPTGQVYAVVTRIPHPQSRHTHVVTPITCDATRALKSIAEYLTSDENLKVAVEKANWSDGWPVSFQMLFHLKLEQHNIEGTPELICWAALTR